MLSVTVPKLITRVKKLREDAMLPVYAKEGDSGADLFAVEDTSWTEVVNKDGICIGYKAIVKTGLAVELPPEREWQVRSRSGNAAKFNIMVFNSPGTVDNEYRGEVMVILMCLGKPLGEYSDGIKRGTKIAQVVLGMVEQTSFLEVDKLSSTERGEGGFNSTGTFKKD